MSVGENHPVAQEMLDVTSAVQAAQTRVEELAAHLKGAHNNTIAGEHLTTASRHLGTAATVLAAAIEAYTPGMHYEPAPESQATGEIVPAGVHTFEGEIVLANAATDKTESGLSLADGLVSAFLPPEVDDRLLTSSQAVFTMTVANRERGSIGAMGRHGPRDLRDIYMLGRAGLQELGFGELTIGRIDEYLQHGRPTLPPLPEEGNIAWAALLYETLQEVPARVALGSLCDQVLAGGGIGVNVALDSLRGRLEYPEFMRTEEDRTNVDRATRILASFVEQYTATKRELRARFSNFRL